jgi:hypothetical protein
MRSRRYAMSMAATFGGIHFYTQWFEGLRTTPQMMITAGIVARAVGGAISGEARCQRSDRMRSRAKGLPRALTCAGRGQTIASPVAPAVLSLRSDWRGERPLIPIAFGGQNSPTFSEKF